MTEGVYNEFEGDKGRLNKTTTEPIKFSKSRFDVQKKCLGIYNYRYIEKVDVPLVIYPATVIGEVIHYYLELFFANVTEENYKWLKERIYKPALTYKVFLKKTGMRNFVEEFQEYLQTIKKDKTKEFRVSRGWKQEDFEKSADSWMWEILKFILKIFEYKTFISEMEFSCNYKNVQVNGIIDLVIEDEKNIYVIDFKTTKDSSTYYFVDWETDPQSLTYYYALWKEKKKKITYFAYFCFNMLEKTILVNRIEYKKDYIKNFETIMEKFLYNHNISGDKKHWSPSKENCKWCDFKNKCELSIK